MKTNKKRAAKSCCPDTVPLGKNLTTIIYFYELMLLNRVFKITTFVYAHGLTQYYEIKIKTCIS